jgi:hypothetical protein
MNPNALYILRDGNFTDFKYILRHVGEFGVNLGRGNGQKTHLVSPLELRLSSYLMAMCNFNYKLTYSLNSFNELKKDQYLPCIPQFERKNT